MAESISIPAVILAGGSSSRMGKDKAMLPVGGVPMLERVARVALEACGRVIIVGRVAPLDWPAAVPARFMEDGGGAKSKTQKAKDKTGEGSGGPLVGLITALEEVGSAVLVLPCDTPLVSADLLRGLLAAHAPPAIATVAFLAGWPEPTLAVYTPALLPTLRQMLAENRRALHPLAALPGVAAWHVPAAHEAELLNVNDAASLAEAERVAAQMKLPDQPSTS